MQPTMIDKERNPLNLLTVDEVGALLKVPPKTIRQWVYLRRIPNIKLNGHVRFMKSELDTWIKQSSR